MPPLRPAFEAWNVALFEAIHATAESPRWAVALARVAIDAPMFAAVALVLWRLARRRAGFWPDAWRIVLAYGIACVIEAATSVLAFHPRPFAAGYSRAWVRHAANNAMPSSHVAAALILALALFARKERRWGALVAALAAAVAWGRIYLGLHWPEDMLGSLFSALLSFGLATLLQRAVACLRGRPAAAPVAGEPPPAA